MPALFLLGFELRESRASLADGFLDSLDLQCHVLGLGLAEFEFRPQALEIVKKACLTRVQDAQFSFEAPDVGLDRSFTRSAIQRLLCDRHNERAGDQRH